MSEIILGTILGGSLLLTVMLYPSSLILLYLKAKNEKTNSKGIKNLKFQQYNAAWQKYIR